MKQSIEYYYSLKINELFLENNTYHFTLDKEDYYFVYFHRSEKDLKDILQCISELKAKNIDCHDIILNNKKEILTKIDNVNYILLKVHNKDEIYEINDLIQMNKKLLLINQKNDLHRNDWANLWSAKIDYIEQQLKEIKVDSIITYSIDYYLGLAENAIYYVNSISLKYQISSNDKIVLSRKRILIPNYKLNYLNPLTFIFDLEVRDIAEYIKSSFFAGEDALLELETYLKSIKLSLYSYNMLFARLLYPSYYFDIYEGIINKNDDSEKLLKIISKVNDYEIFLKKAYLQIARYAPLESINYLIY